MKTQHSPQFLYSFGTCFLFFFFLISNGFSNNIENIQSDNFYLKNKNKLLSPNGPSVVLPAVITFCENTSNVLSPAINNCSPCNFIWNDGSTEPELTVSQPGNYSVTVSDGTSCTDVASIQVETNSPSEVFLDVNDPPCFMALGNMHVQQVVSGTVPYSYSINGGTTFQNFPNFNSLPSGDYNFLVRDNNGCELEENFSIKEGANWSIMLEDSVFLNFDDEPYPINNLVDLPDEEIASVSWFPPDFLSCNNCPNLIFNPVETTTYTITVRDLNGCEQSAEIHFAVVPEIKVFFPNTFSPNGDGINDIYVVYGDPQVVKSIEYLRIFNNRGGLVFEFFNFRPNEFSFGWDGTFKGKKVQAAVYTYFSEVETVDGRVVLFSGTITKY